MNTYTTQSSSDTVIDCRNCGTTIYDKFCSRCGQPASLKRINGHYILHEIEHILHFERGILYTVKALLLNPGRTIKGFFVEDRNRLVKPIIFIIVTSAIYSLITGLLHVDNGYVRFSEESPSATGTILKWVQSHYGYSNLLMGVFIALWLKLFFRKYDYNFFEILIALCFIMGMSMLALTVFAILEKLSKTSLTKESGFLFILYASWAIGQFYDKRRKMSYVKAFGAYILGMISFTLVVVALGTAIDVAIDVSK
jgi:hypothetical protein